MFECNNSHQSPVVSLKNFKEAFSIILHVHVQVPTSVVILLLNYYKFQRFYGEERSKIWFQVRTQVENIMRSSYRSDWVCAVSMVICYWKRENSCKNSTGEMRWYSQMNCLWEELIEQLVTINMKHAILTIDYFLQHAFNCVINLRNVSRICTLQMALFQNRIRNEVEY